MLTRLGFLGCVLVLAGCSAGVETTVEPTAAHGAELRQNGVHIVELWVQDADLLLPAVEAAGRLAETAGLTVRVGMAGGEVPVFRDEAGMGEQQSAVAWIAIDKAMPVELLETALVHRIMHAFGAAHVADGAGVLAPNPSGPQDITAADLDSLCAAADCLRFYPES